MTLPVDWEPSDEIPDLEDIELHQALEDCFKVLEASPVEALTSPQGWAAGRSLHCLLESMLSTASGDRRLRRLRDAS